MEFRDYYQTLGVERNATADEIRKAFRKLARKYHPDVSKAPDADERMKEVNEAYAVLGDAEKRAAYDQVGQGFAPGQEFSPPPGWDDGFEWSGRQFHARDAGEFSDFFAELFGRMGRDGPGRPGRHEFHGRGEDHIARVHLDLEDAYRGANRQITLRSPRIDAEGRVQFDTRTLDVRIPKGVREGQIIRLAGQGHPGFGDGQAGDLLLEVHFRPHPRFRAEGRDVQMTLPVAPWEAALGAVIEVDMPNGKLRVRIPAGAQSGRQLRVRGHGLPGAQPGDLLLELRVVLPSADDPRARALYERMAEELDFDPRGSAGHG
ncbi:MAG: DnaJ domain-containing protein [Rhodocyclaceae bacterium]|nr:DnaJ domain-containing protein [Rhodocyclaceae bacterium]